jgi:hypothetical protein
MRVLLALLAVGAIVLGNPDRSRGTEACTADATKALIQSFVRGYAAGHVAAIDRMFAPAPRFAWFSAGKPQSRLGMPSHARSTLAAYFRDAFASTSGSGSSGSAPATTRAVGSSTSAAS